MKLRDDVGRRTCFSHTANAKQLLVSLVTKQILDLRMIMTHTAWTSDELAAEWIDEKDRMDSMLAPFGKRLLAAAQLGCGAAVLDVGCGTGSTTLAAWKRVAPTGMVTGVDIAAVMLATAQRRLDRHDPSSRVRLICADAGTHPFQQGSFDVVLSRFGVGHFADPRAAFDNLRSALRPDGRLVFTEWADRASNEWMTLVEDVARRVLGPLPGHHRPDHHRQFSTATRLRSTLEEAGFDPAVTAVRDRVPVGDSVSDVINWFRTLPDAKFLNHVGPDQSNRYLNALAEELALRSDDRGVQLGATAWLVEARPSRLRRNG
jgi:ubiquinone/menaquinone biosynthesis C-methylase UbiE